VASTPPTDRELDGWREEADRFIAELDEEHYLHYSGQKPDLELEPIYEQHAGLTSLETARRIGAAVEGRRNRELWRFACEGYLGRVTRPHEERLAELEASLTAEHGSEKLPYRMLPPAIANTADRAERAELERLRNELTERELNPLYLEADAAVRAAVVELGAPTYLELYRDRFGVEIDTLAEQCRAFLADTEVLYEERMDALLRESVGVGLAEAERWDVRRLFRGTAWDADFPGERMLPALRGTLADLGIDLDRQRNVHLDVEQRPNKDPRAFCAPIEVPDRIVLVIQPIGGPDDWYALFHEAGHAEHFAHTSASLPVEARRFGDNAVTEGWAMLFQHLVDDPGWLARRLDVGDPEAFARHGAVVLLFFVRRYAAKLLYEIEYHGPSEPTALQDRYVELLSDALKIAPSPTDYLADIDGGFYVTSYLRAWAFEAQLRRYLRERYGTNWFAQRKAGSLLRELWELGQGPTADELLKDVTGSPIELDAVAERIRETLRA
jgi:hypothetical protein